MCGAGLFFLFVCLCFYFSFLFKSPVFEVSLVNSTRSRQACSLLGKGRTVLLERSLIQMGGQGFLKDSGEQVALLGGAGKKLLHVLIMSRQGNCHDSGAVSGCAWVSFLFPSQGERLGSREEIFWAHRGQLWCGQVGLSPLFPVKTMYFYNCVSVSRWKFIMARGDGGKPNLGTVLLCPEVWDGSPYASHCDLAFRDSSDMS